MSAPTFIYPPPSTGGTPVGGSGTPGTIPVWSTGTTLTDSILKQSSTNVLFVGGTAQTWQSFSRVLQLGATSTSSFGDLNSDTHVTNNGVFDGVWTRVNAAPAANYYQSGNTHVWRYAATGAAGSAITWSTLMASDASGNVGIGTASPYARVSARGSAGVGIGAWSTSGASPGTPVAASLFLGDDNFYNASFYNQCPGLSAVYDVTRGNSSALAMYYYNGASRAEGVRLDGSGNVGIGTASPNARLHVQSAATEVLRLQTTTGTIYTQFIRATSTTIGFIGDGQSLVTGASANDFAMRADAGNVIFSTGANERARITSTGNVGIGTTSPTTFAASGSVVLGQNVTSQQWALKIFGGNDANRAPVISLFRAGNAEAIVGQIKDGSRSVLGLGTGGGIANFNDATLAAYCPVKIGPDYTDMSGAAYGLKLPATPGATGAGTEQILDCYQENTGWVPGVSFGGGTTGITYTTQTGSWTRIGNLVFVTGRITLSNKGSSTGIARITNLPATVGGTSAQGGGGVGYASNITFGNQLGVYPVNSQSVIGLSKMTSGATGADLTDADFTNTSDISFSLVYRV